MPAPRKTLDDVLGDAQKWGTLGRRSISETIAHARQFLAPLEDCRGSVVDIGTGAGVPGLVIAVERPDLQLVLVDRRATRMDALSRGVLAMGLGDRVEVITADVDDLGRNPNHAGRYGAVVCRGFGPPEVTVRLARPLQKNGGTIVVSEPPSGSPSRWNPQLLDELGLTRVEGYPGVAVFRCS
jgi:16S rRNA (guanine527-N7)-methyltransferase